MASRHVSYPSVGGRKLATFDAMLLVLDWLSSTMHGANQFRRFLFVAILMFRALISVKEQNYQFFNRTYDWL